MHTTNKVKWFWLLLTWAVLMAVATVFAVSGVNMRTLTCDVLQFLDQPAYLGLLSYVGILAWCAAGSICLFSSHMIKMENQLDKSSGFLRYIGILSLILLADDLWILHEVVIPKYLQLPETTLYVVYLVYVTLWLLKYWRLILARTDYGLLLTAFFLLAVSLAIDIDALPGGIDVEDGFKLLGIVTFAFYCIITSAQLLGAASVSVHTDNGGTD